MSIIDDLVRISDAVRSKRGENVHIDLVLDFDPDNPNDIRRYHNNAVYHAQVMLAAHIVTRQPRGLIPSWYISAEEASKWIL